MAEAVLGAVAVTPSTPNKRTRGQKGRARADRGGTDVRTDRCRSRAPGASATTVAGAGGPRASTRARPASTEQIEVSTVSGRRATGADAAKGAPLRRCGSRGPVDVRQRAMPRRETASHVPPAVRSSREHAGRDLAGSSASRSRNSSRFAATVTATSAAGSAQQDVITRPRARAAALRTARGLPIMSSSPRAIGRDELRDADCRELLDPGISPRRRPPRDGGRPPASAGAKRGPPDDGRPRCRNW